MYPRYGKWFPKLQGSIHMEFKLGIPSFPPMLATIINKYKSHVRSKLKYKRREISLATIEGLSNDWREDPFARAKFPQQPSLFEQQIMRWSNVSSSYNIDIDRSKTFKKSLTEKYPSLVSFRSNLSSLLEETFLSWSKWTKISPVLQPYH